MSAVQEDFTEFALTDLEALIEVAEDGSIETNSHFEVESLEQLDWVMRKVMQANERLAEIDQVTAVEIDRVKAWQEQASKQYRQTIDFMTQLAGSYHRRLLTDDPSRKTITVPNGKSSARKLPDSYAFDQGFIEWAKANRPELLRVKYEVEAREAKEAVEVQQNIDGEYGAFIDGEIVPGVAFEPGGTKYTVTAVKS